MSQDIVEPSWRGGAAMGLGRYVVDAIVLEGRSPSELARTHHLSRSWIYELVSRYRQGGYPTIEPRSRRPRSCAHAVGPKVQAIVLKLRRDLVRAGHDAGAQTIVRHLARRLKHTAPSLTTVWRILHRHGLITPPSHTSGRAPRSPASRRSCPMSSGRPTPRIGPSAMGRRPRSSTSSTITRAWRSRRSRSPP